VYTDRYHQLLAQNYEQQCRGKPSKLKSLTTIGSPFRYNPTTPGKRDCSTGDLFFHSCGRKYVSSLSTAWCILAFSPKSVRKTSVAHRILVNIWRHHGMSAGTMSAVEHNYRRVLDIAKIPQASNATSSGFAGCNSVSISRARSRP